jgi:hypothetical protein
MTLEEALSIKSARFWDVEDVPVIETTKYNYWAFSHDKARIFSGGSVERNGGEISREAFLELLRVWNSKYPPRDDIK